MFKIKYFLAFFLLGFFLSIVLHFAKAEVNNDGSETTVTKSTSSSNSTSGSNKIDTTTDVVTQTTVQKDSDGDGILDAVDPHPNIQEIYIVKDDNKNGIVDKFEK